MNNKKRHIGLSLFLLSGSIFIFSVLFIIFSTSLSLALTTSTSSITFSVGNCQIPTPDGPWILSQSCYANHYYCAGTGTDTGELHDSFYEGGNEPIQEGSYVFGGCGINCCPDLGVGRNYCPVADINVIADACVFNEEECSSSETVDLCPTDEGCVWDNSCKDIHDLASCSDYETEVACTDDILFLGTSGDGTEYCESIDATGKYFVTNCMCSWDAINSICLLNQTIEDASGNVVGNCVRDNTLGECGVPTEGIQLISWNLTWYPATSVDAKDSCSCENVGCVQELHCGTSAAILGFFSLTNLIITIVLLVVFYLIYLKIRVSKKINKKKKK